MSAPNDTSERPSERPPDQTRVSPSFTEPLSPLETRLANAEAIERAPDTSEAVSDARRHGRIEAETRRISDEVTRQAQERRNAQRAREPQQAQQQARSPESAASVSPGVAPTRRPFPGSFGFEHILVPLDGTFYAERALPYAMALARLTGASITLGHVSAPSTPAPAHLARQLVEEVVGDVEPRATNIKEYLDAQRVLQSFRVPATSEDTIEDSDAVFGLRRLAEQNKSDLIVLATHARRGFERQVLGSTADGLVEQSHLPLLIIPPGAVVPAEAPSFARVLVPLDGSEVAEYALGLLVGLLRTAAKVDAAMDARADSGRSELAHREITLFTVTESRALRGDAQSYLDEVEARLKAAALPAGVQISKRVLLGSAPGAIVAVAAHGARSPEVVSGPFDLVVMATHGRGGLGRLLYGSVARYVLPHSAVPVLLVHPKDVSI